MVQKKEIAACIRCGSAYLSSTSLGPGMHMPGGGGPPTYSCNECGFIGNPIVFDSDDDYQKFLKLKKR